MQSFSLDPEPWPTTHTFPTLYHHSRVIGGRESLSLGAVQDWPLITARTPLHPQHASIEQVVANHKSPVWALIQKLPSPTFLYDLPAMNILRIAVDSAQGSARR